MDSTAPTHEQQQPGAATAAGAGAPADVVSAATTSASPSPGASSKALDSASATTLDVVVDASDSKAFVVADSAESTASKDAKPAADVEAAVDPDAPQFVKWTTATLVPLFFGLVSAHFLAALDATIVSTALGAISSDLNAFSQISWVATAYVLTFNAFQPLVGKFAQIFGHRPLTLFGIIVFMAGSAGCGGAKSIEMLILFRSIQGIGGAFLLAMIIISISDMFPLEERPKYLTVLWINFGVSTIIGPLLGGAFTDHLTWRWAFLINLPVGAVAGILVFLFLRIPFKAASLKEQIKRIDMIGAVLLLVSVLMILLPTTLGGTKWAWSSPQVIASYIVAAVLISVFVWYELTQPPEPIIPPFVFKIQTVVSCFVTNFFQGMCFFAFVFYAPTYFQVVRGDSATASGLELLPLLMGLVVFSIVGTILLPFVKGYKPFIITGSIFITAGTIWFSFLDEFSSHAVQIVALLLVGIGLGLSIQMVILACQAAVSQEETGTVSTLAGFFQSIGGGIGLAVLSTIFNGSLETAISELPQFLIDYLKAAQDQGGSSTSLSALNNLPGLTPEQNAMIIHAYVSSFQKIFRYAIPFGVISIISPWFITTTKIRSREEMMASGPSH
ncbi:major facilitator superfamily domain-containing protein [Zopfochytrium polystomum]|nr:major facilitator superfamily domain-containing protein [Zopfochytrium polystomum]